MGSTDSKAEQGPLDGPDGATGILSYCTDCKLIKSNAQDGKKVDEYQKWANSVKLSRSGPSTNLSDAAKAPSKSEIASKFSKELFRKEPPKASKPNSSHGGDSAVTSPSVTPLRRTRRSMVGNIPKGWSNDLLDQLQVAVEDAAREAKVKAPGFRDMQQLLAARALGKRAGPSSAYGVRQDDRLQSQIELLLFFNTISAAQSFIFLNNLLTLSLHISLHNLCSFWEKVSRRMAPISSDECLIR